MKPLALPALLAATMFVGGCALPLPLTIASLVADGVSYATTEKSLTDHGLSALTERDCAMHRLFTENEICHTAVEYEVTDAPTGREPEASSLRAPTADMYLVVGSARGPASADALAQRYAPMSPKILATQLGNGPVLYRVVVGPVTKEGYPMARRTAERMGIEKPWPLEIGSEDWRKGEALQNRPQEQTQTANRI